MPRPSLAALQAAEDPDPAALVIGASEALWEKIGHLWRMPGRSAFAEPRLRTARERVGITRWDAAVEAGRRLSYQQLCALMLEDAGV